MSMTIYEGQLDIVLPDGSRHDYERFIITRNPDAKEEPGNAATEPTHEWFIECVGVAILSGG